MLNFQDFFNSERTLVATFSKTRALFPRKYIVEEGMDLPKPSKKLLRLHSSAFDLEYSPKNVSF